MNRQATTRVPIRLDSLNDVTSGSRPLLPGASSHAVPPTQDTVKTALVSASHSTFDAVELLGPSLSDVLTFVSPPQPQQTPQEAGEVTTRVDTKCLDKQSSQRSTSAFKGSAKFDLPLSRSAIIGNFVDLSIDNAHKTEVYFVTMLSTIQCDATGLVLLHNTTVVIFLETTADQFVIILKQLQRQQILDSRSMKILANCDDHGMRILQGLYFHKVGKNRSSTGDWADNEPQQCIIDTFLNLIKLIRGIGPMPPGEIRTRLSSLSTTEQTFLPSTDLVLWLLKREELMTLKEYLAFFDNPVVIELMSERVWPVRPLIYY